MVCGSNLPKQRGLFECAMITGFNFSDPSALQHNPMVILIFDCFIPSSLCWVGTILLDGSCFQNFAVSSKLKMSLSSYNYMR